MSLWQLIWYGGLGVAAAFCLLAWPRKNEDGTVTPRRLLDREAVLCCGILLIGLTLRLVYISYTDVATRQHDVYSIARGKGHAGYIYYFFQNGIRLPDFSPDSVSQFYHPPLHHILASRWMRAGVALGKTEDAAIESVQVLTALYSFLMLPVFWKLLKKLELSGSALLLPLAILAVSPGLIIMGGDINNDMLMNLLTLCAFTAAVCWYKTPSLLRILLCALAMGGAMMAKLSAFLAAPPIAFLFLERFFAEREARGRWRLVGQFAAFGVVCVPLGLWWPLYCKFVWDIPLGYVPSLSETASQYIGGYSAADRLFCLRDGELKSVFIAWADQPGYDYNEHNVFVALLKTSLFDESTLFRTAGKSGTKLHENTIGLRAAVTLFWTNLALILAGFVGEVTVLLRAIRAKKPAPVVVALAVFPLIVLIPYVSFCFGYPHTCTMNFRYAVPMQYAGLAFLGLWLGQTEKRRGGRTASGGEIAKTAVIAVLTAVFVCCSALVILQLGKV